MPRPTGPKPPDFFTARREWARRFIAAALKRNRGNRTAAAEELGMHRNTLIAYLRKLW